MSNEDRFWSMIESAWVQLGPQAAADRVALTRRVPDLDEDPDYADVARWLDLLLDLLRADCDELSDGELLDLDQVLERKLADLDRPDIHEVVRAHTMGSCIAVGSSWRSAGNFMLPSSPIREWRSTTLSAAICASSLLRCAKGGDRPMASALWQEFPGRGGATAFGPQHDTLRAAITRHLTDE